MYTQDCLLYKRSFVNKKEPIITVRPILKTTIVYQLNFSILKQYANIENGRSNISFNTNMHPCCLLICHAPAKEKYREEVRNQMIKQDEGRRKIIVCLKTFLFMSSIPFYSSWDRILDRPFSIFAYCFNIEKFSWYSSSDYIKYNK